MRVNAKTIFKGKLDSFSSLPSVLAEVTIRDINIINVVMGQVIMVHTKPLTLCGCETTKSNQASCLRTKAG